MTVSSRQSGEKVVEALAWEGSPLPVLHTGRGIKGSCHIFMLCRPQAMSLVIWEAVALPMCGSLAQAFEIYWSYPCLQKLMVRNIFLTNLLREMIDFIPCELCRSGNAQQIQIFHYKSEWGHIQTTSTANHKTTSAFQEAHTVTLTRQLRFVTFVMISGCSKSTQMLSPCSRRWVKVCRELLLAKDTPYFCILQFLIW